MPLKAALYIRVSTHHQIDKDSLPLQRNDLINYSNYILNIQDYEIFEDAGYSAKNTDRPAYQEMMRRAYQGKFSHILVWKIDRISRNLLDFAAMYAAMKKLNIIFVSKNEQFDTSTAIGEAMLKIILVFAELERNMTSERVSAIMKARAEKGLWNGANIPFGYDWSPAAKFPVINDYEANIVNTIFKHYAETKSLIRVSEYLRNNKIKTKRGGKWESTTVMQMLRNPFYKGTMRYNYRSTARGKKNAESEWILIHENHPPVVTADLWQQCNDILDHNSRLYNKAGSPRSQKHTHVFSSILRCVECEGGTSSCRDRVRKSGWRPSKYQCTSLLKHSGCTNHGSVGDINLGPFIFNYINNLLQLKKQIHKYNTVQEIEKTLLNGEAFSDIIGIENADQIFLAMKAAVPKVTYKSAIPSDPINVPDDMDKIILDIAQKERALERLKKLFLYGDDAMSEKEYITTKNTLIQEINSKKAAMEQLSQPPQQLSDEVSFLKTASSFILLRQLSDNIFINYRELAEHTDPVILKDFVLAIINKIYFLNRRVTAIEFKNGITHKFIYQK